VLQIIDLLFFTWWRAYSHLKYVLHH
jgi:hypothetical protein